MENLIIYLFTLVIPCSVLSAEKSDCSPPVCCHFAGSYVSYSWAESFRFNATDLQIELNRCEAVSYGKYLLDQNDMTPKDKEAFRVIADSGKTIYLRVGHTSQEKWSDTLKPKDEKKLNSQIDTLLTFAINFNVSVIILDNIGLYNDNTTNVDEQIISFTNKIKNKTKMLKVGLYVNGQDYILFSDLNAFNFTASNAVIDSYFIDMTVSNLCDALTQIESVNPLQSHHSLLTLEQQSKAVNASAMDKCSVYAVLQVPAVVSDALGSPDIFDSYSKVCAEYNEGKDVKRYCVDTLLTLYNQAMFVRNYFTGFTLSMIEGDDFNRICGCNKYPVSNSLISGWYWEKNSHPEICTKIDEIDRKNTNSTQ